MHFVSRRQTAEKKVQKTITTSCASTTIAMSVVPKLYYWGGKGRGHPIILLARLTGNQIDWETAPKWPDM